MKSKELVEELSPWDDLQVVVYFNGKPFRITSVDREIYKSDSGEIEQVVLHHESI